MNDPKIEACAHAAHEANRAFCSAIDDPTVPVSAPWEESPEEDRRGKIRGVENALSGATPEQQHDAWMHAKLRDGWTYGAVKDAEKKTHPCMVRYSELPPGQQEKDRLFLSTVRAMARALGIPCKAMTPKQPEIEAVDLDCG